MKRRIFLRGAGGAALAAPFLSSVHEQAAKAQSVSAETPKRLVIFFTHNGCLTTRWFPKNENGALTADSIAGGTLEVLTPHVDKLLVPRGLATLNGYASTQTIDPHDQAMGSKLTCAMIIDDSDRYASSHSLDHEIARQVNPGGADPLVLSVGSASDSIKEVLSFSGPGAAFPSNVNPKTVYTQLTGLFGTGGDTGGDTGGEMTEGDYRVALGESVIDVVGDDLRAFQSLNMSASDQVRIQDWLDLLRSTEKSVVSAACTAEIAASLGINDTALDEASGSGFGDGLAASFTKGGDMMMNLIALNMICDANRAIILNYPGYVKFGWDGVEHDADHHGLSHRNGSFQVGGTCKAGVLDMIGDIDAWYAGKYAKLVSLLDSIGEGDGTLLDNSAVMWLPELSDGNAHNLNNMPIVIAGSCGGYLKQGEVVNVEGDDIGPGNSEGNCSDGGESSNSDTQGTGTGGFGRGGGRVPINKLYVTLMNAVGCTADDGSAVTEFGVFDKEGDGNSGITDPGELTDLKA